MAEKDTPRVLAWIGRHELVFWSALVLFVLGIWGITELADEVMGGETRAFDRAVVMALRNPADPHDPIGPHWLDEMVRDFTSLGGWGIVVFICLSAIGYLMLQRRFRGSLLLAVAVLGGFGLSALLKDLFDRTRPEILAHGTETMSPAFPSGHSLMAAVVYLTLGAVLARMQPNIYLKAYFILLSIFLTLVVGVSRVYLGVHWPTDVLAGWLIGALWALFIYLLTRLLQRRTKMIGEDIAEQNSS